MEDIEIFYLIKGAPPLSLNFMDGSRRTFSPSAIVPAEYADKLLNKPPIIVGGCCGQPKRVMRVFATKEQIESGERPWIEPVGRKRNGAK